MTTYKEVINYLFSALPMYQRVGAAAYKTDITNTVELMKALDNPQDYFRTIHVAGTNGKGSVSNFLASILRAAGYKVGLYTSPHLVDFRERIRIDGEMIPESDVVDFVNNNKALLDRIKPSFFEMTVAMAFQYFAEKHVDVAVVEVGMGGRLDSTNIVNPDLSIITNIGWDHTQFLGDTLQAIAGEKAGIIKDKVPVVIGETQPETEPVFMAVAKEHNALIYFADQNYVITDAHESNRSLVLSISSTTDGEPVYAGLRSPLCGDYQKKNIVTVVQAVEVLRTLGYNLPLNAVTLGVESVVVDNGFRGRWQILSNHPLTICETAHNKDGIQSMLKTLAGMEYSNLHVVYGCVNDKDYTSILRLLPHEATYYYCKPDVPRGLDVETLHAAAKQCGLQGEPYRAIATAIETARQNADEQSLILITGSIFLVADALKYFSAK